MLNLNLVVAQGTVTHLDTTAEPLFSLPAGAIPLFAVVQTETAFNDSGTDLVQIGKGTDNDYYASGISVAATGGQLIMLNQSGALTAQAQITATFTGQNSDATAGRAKVNLVYATPFYPV